MIGSLGADVVITGSGDDTVSGGAGEDVFVVGSGTNSFDGGADTDTLTFARFTRGVTLTALGSYSSGSGSGTIAGVERIVGSGFADTLSLAATGGSLWGRDGDDTLTGSAAADHLFGGDGADSLYGGGGIDILRGGTGADAVFGGTGNDILFMQDNLDSLFGGSDDDNFIFRGGIANSIDGGDGIDKLVFTAMTSGLTLDHAAITGIEILAATDFADQITMGNKPATVFGRGGDDTIFGGTSRDYIHLGTGDDSANGGGGEDTILTISGSNTVEGGSGNDLFILSGNDMVTDSAGDDTYILRDGASVTITDSGGIDKVSFVSQSTGIALNATGTGWPNPFSLTAMTGIEIFVGSNFGDRFEDSTATETFFGGAGADTFILGSGSAGSSVNDVAFGGAGDDDFTLFSEFQTVHGGAGSDTITLTAFSAGGKVLYGGGEADTFTLSSFSANNTLYGGDGDDQFTVAGAGVGAGNIYIGGTGTDLLTIDVFQNVTLDLTTGAGTMTPGATIFTDGIEELVTSGGHDTITIGTGHSVSANDGFDTVILTGLNAMTADGGGGTDLLDLSQILFGVTYDTQTGLITDGFSTIATTSGFENFVATNFADHVTVYFVNERNYDLGAGDDTLVLINTQVASGTVSGGFGADTLDMSGALGAFYDFGTSPAHFVTGFEKVIGSNNSFNNISASNGEVFYIEGGQTIDILSLFNVGNGTLIGNGGDDRLQIGFDTGVVDAGSGNDQILGGNTNVQITLGSGADVVAVSLAKNLISSTDVSLNNTVANTITDFVSGEDTLNFSPSDAFFNLLGGSAVEGVSYFVQDNYASGDIAFDESQGGIMVYDPAAGQLLWDSSDEDANLFLILNFQSLPDLELSDFASLGNGGEVPE